MSNSLDVIDAAASIVVAVCTGGLAIATFRVTRSAEEETKATVALAEEARRDRELAWRVSLTVEGESGVHSSPDRSSEVTITNIGTVPAFGCRWARLWGQWWSLTPPADLGGGSHHTVTAHVETGSQ